MFGDLSAEDCEQFLHENIYGRIGCHAFGKTYIVPISYAYQNGVFYCHTFEGQKLDMMRSNPAVCFEVDQIDNMGNWKSVIAHGTFKELEGTEREKGIDILMDRTTSAVVSETVKITPQWPFPEKNYENVTGIIFSITIEEKTGRYEKADPYRM